MSALKLIGHIAASVAQCFALGLLSALISGGIILLVPLHGPAGLLTALAFGNGCAMTLALVAVSTRLRFATRNSDTTERLP